MAHESHLVKKMTINGHILYLKQHYRNFIVFYQPYHAHLLLPVATVLPLLVLLLLPHLSLAEDLQHGQLLTRPHCHCLAALFIVFPSVMSLLFNCLTDRLSV